MKNNLIIALVIFVAASCSPKLNIPYQRNGAVEFVSGDKNTITITSNGFAESEGKAVYYAEINALENILYRGIPNSNQDNPMIANENQLTNSQQTELDNLIRREGYRNFLIQSYRSNGGLSGSNWNILQTVKFDLQALRKYLEDKSIVRKFGL
ncbi:MAG: hypothetical protein IPM42_00380 [Saprospiraceae bacterium]|nr:hypothetical protein [Saprospiraceae bacterium]